MFDEKFRFGVPRRVWHEPGRVQYLDILACAEHLAEFFRRQQQGRHGGRREEASAELSRRWIGTEHGKDEIGMSDRWQTTATLLRVTTTMPSDQSTWLISAPLNGDTEGLQQELSDKVSHNIKSIPPNSIATLAIPSFKVRLFDALIVRIHIYAARQERSIILFLSPKSSPNRTHTSPRLWPRLWKPCATLSTTTHPNLLNTQLSTKRASMTMFSVDGSGTRDGMGYRGACLRPWIL